MKWGEKPTTKVVLSCYSCGVSFSRSDLLAGCSAEGGVLFCECEKSFHTLVVSVLMSQVILRQTVLLLSSKCEDSCCSFRFVCITHMGVEHDTKTTVSRGRIRFR